MTSLFLFSLFTVDPVEQKDDSLVVETLLNDMTSPTRDPSKNEDWREEVDWNSHLVIGNCTKPIEVGKHLLLILHHSFNPLCNIE